MRRSKWLRWSLPLLLAVVVLFSLMASPLVALADTTQDVTVTATPTYISISNDISTWTVNGLTGDSKIDTSTTYFSNPQGDTTALSNPVVDNECRFNVTNDGSVAEDIAITWSHFTGGDAMQNAESAGSCTEGANSFCGYGYYSGLADPTSGHVVAKVSGGLDLISNLASSASKKWGAELQTQTGAWSSGSAMTATITLTATEH